MYKITHYQLNNILGLIFVSNNKNNSNVSSTAIESQIPYVDRNSLPAKILLDFGLTASLQFFRSTQNSHTQTSILNNGRYFIHYIGFMSVKCSVKWSSPMGNRLYILLEYFNSQMCVDSKSIILKYSWHCLLCI